MSGSVAPVARGLEFTILAFGACSAKGFGVVEWVVSHYYSCQGSIRLPDFFGDHQSILEVLNGNACRQGNGSWRLSA